MSTDVSEVRAASIIALIIHTRRRENLNLTLYHTLSCQEEWMKTAKKIGTNRNST
jgi:hypothetical protein